jgi:hypothetical protein
VRTHVSSVIPAKGTITAYCAGSTSGYIFGHDTINGLGKESPFGPSNSSRHGFSSSLGRSTNLKLVSIYALGREGGQKCKS